MSGKFFVFLNDGGCYFRDKLGYEDLRRADLVVDTRSGKALKNRWGKSPGSLPFSARMITTEPEDPDPRSEAEVNPAAPWNWD